METAFLVFEIAEKAELRREMLRCINPFGNTSFPASSDRIWVIAPQIDTKKTCKGPIGLCRFCFSTRYAVAPNYSIGLRSPPFSRRRRAGGQYLSLCYVTALTTSSLAIRSLLFCSSPSSPVLGREGLGEEGDFRPPSSMCLRN